MRSFFLTVVAVVALALTACNSGGSSDSRVSAANCVGPTKFCLTACNLGCSVTGGCSISEIAQNQPIVLSFSEFVDPESINPATISIRTETGETPAGRFRVEDQTITFQPEISLVGGVTTFGFSAGEDYILTLPGGVNESQSLRSISNNLLSAPITCTLSVTQGLVDLDGAPPDSQLITPADSTGVPTDTSIVVEFSELIDIGPFQGGSTVTSPIVYQIRKTRERPNAPGVFECDPGFSPILIQGVPRASVDADRGVTQVTLRPAVQLPSSVCVEIMVTNRVRDLSGKSAVERTFRFFTSSADPVPQTITESFSNDARLDRSRSSGTWAGGRATPGALGGWGIHGSFDSSIGIRQGSKLVFNTDNFTIPASNALFGQSVVINDGRFLFTDFNVPPGIEVAFQGSQPPIVQVVGSVNIEGTLSVNGETVAANYNSLPTTSPIPPFPQVPNPGQAGAAGGPFAGAGGNGGASCEGTGTTALQAGQPGEDLVVSGMSGYAGGVGGTGGLGAPVFPSSGLITNVVFNLFNNFCGMIAGGGGGGGFSAAGGTGRAIRSFTGVPADLGPATPGGSDVAFVPRPGGVSSIDHFLVGGSGGGGGGSQPTNMQRARVLAGTFWNGGGGGTGGGGVLAFRVGGTFGIASGGALESRGGDGPTYTNSSQGPPSPGGAGSGGSLLIQTVGGVVQEGDINVSGGNGARLTHLGPNVQPIESEGGSGGAGYVRVEAPTAPAPTALGNVIGLTPGADNVGMLDDTDEQVAMTSLWYPTNQVFAPTFDFYELRARINGQLVVFTDNPDGAFNPANDPNGAVQLFIQGAEVNAATQQPNGDPGPWRQFVNGQGGRQSINTDNATGFRFMLLFDRSVSQDIFVEEFRVQFRA